MSFSSFAFSFFQRFFLNFFQNFFEAEIYNCNCSISTFRCANENQQTHAIASRKTRKWRKRKYKHEIKPMGLLL